MQSYKPEPDATKLETPTKEAGLASLAEQLKLEVHGASANESVCTSQKTSFLDKQLQAALVTVASLNDVPLLTSLLLKEVRKRTSKMMSPGTLLEPMAFRVALLHASTPGHYAGKPGGDADILKKEAELLVELCKAMNSEELWNVPPFQAALGVLPELGPLLSTPFMIRIVVKILPMLSRLASSPASVKSEMMTMQ